jgi:hypothetical protein
MENTIDLCPPCRESLEKGIAALIQSFAHGNKVHVVADRKVGGEIKQWSSEESTNGV